MLQIIANYSGTEKANKSSKWKKRLIKKSNVFYWSDDVIKGVMQAVNEEETTILQIMRYLKSNSFYRQTSYLSVHVGKRYHNYYK